MTTVVTPRPQPASPTLTYPTLSAWLRCRRRLRPHARHTAAAAAAAAPLGADSRRACTPGAHWRARLQHTAVRGRRRRR